MKNQASWLTRLLFLSTALVAASASMGSSCSAFRACKGESVCNVEPFSGTDPNNPVDGVTLLLPINQGRGFGCPSKTDLGVTFWGFEAGHLEDEEKHFDLPFDRSKLGASWQEEPTMKSDCVKVGRWDSSSGARRIEACGRIVDLPWPEHATVSGVWGVCAYPDGTSILGFITGTSDQSGKTFREVRAGYAFWPAANPSG
jgi:hypothetical protein